MLGIKIIISISLAAALTKLTSGREVNVVLTGILTFAWMVMYPVYLAHLFANGQITSMNHNHSLKCKCTASSLSSSKWKKKAVDNHCRGRGLIATWCMTHGGPPSRVTGWPPFSIAGIQLQLVRVNWAYQRWAAAVRLSDRSCWSFDSHSKQIHRPCVKVSVWYRDNYVQTLNPAKTHMDALDYWTPWLEGEVTVSWFRIVFFNKKQLNCTLKYVSENI